MTGSEVAEHALRLRAWLQAQRTSLDPYRSRRPGDLGATVEHDRGLLRLLYDAGWSRHGWPVEVGGLGGSVLLRAVLYDELASADVEMPEAFVILETLGPILAEFSPGIAARHLPGFLRGEELWGQGFSEPEAGSDLAHLRTRAVKDGSGFLVNGQKVWTTLGQFASHAAVLARTGAPDSAHRGLSMLWVDLAGPGVRVRPIAASSGRDEFAEMFFDEVPVDADALIGEEGQGWAVAMFLLQYERGMYAWQRQAILQRRLRNAIERLKRRELVDAGARLALAAALGVVSRLRLLSLRTVSRLAAGENPGGEISVDKITLGQAEQTTFDALRLLEPGRFFGGSAEADEVLREEWFYSRASTIFGGAIDIQRDIVADRVLELPEGRPLIDDERAALLELVSRMLGSGDLIGLLSQIDESGIADELWRDQEILGAMLGSNAANGGGSALWSAVLSAHCALPVRSVVLPMPGGDRPPGERTERGVRIDGLRTAPPVGFADRMSVPLDDRWVEVGPDELAVVPVAGFAPSLGLTHVSGVAMPLSESLDGGWAAAEAAMARLLAYDLLGAGDAALALARAHVSERTQFGRPIGAFQAVRHRLAQAHVDLTGARLLVEESVALGAVAQRTIVAAEAARAAVHAVAAAQQVCGGMGFAAEFGLGGLVRRVYAVDALLGGHERLAVRGGTRLLEESTALAELLGIGRLDEAAGTRTGGGVDA